MQKNFAMNKYFIAKVLVCVAAFFSLLCFFFPFAHGDAIFGRASGIAFIAGEVHARMPLVSSGWGADTSNLTGAVDLGVVMTRISLVISLAAVILSAVPFAPLRENEAKNKIHVTLIVSISLSGLSALLNFISMLVGRCSTFTTTSTISEVVYHHEIYDAFYTYIGLILIVPLAVATIALCLLVRKETAVPAGNAANGSTPFVVQPSPQASASHIADQTVTKRSEPVARPEPMSKKDVEGLFAYIWVRQYNMLPFQQALDKITAYLTENQYAIHPNDAKNLLANIWARKYNALPFETALQKIEAYLEEIHYCFPSNEADNLLANIWALQYVSLPFEVALPKIKAYLKENKCVILSEKTARETPPDSTH